MVKFARLENQCHCRVLDFLQSTEKVIRQQCVFDQEDTTEIAVCHQQKKEEKRQRQNEFQSKIRKCRGHHT